MTRSFYDVILFAKYCSGEIKEDGMGEAYGTNGVEEKVLEEGKETCMKAEA